MKVYRYAAVKDPGRYAVKVSDTTMLTKDKMIAKYL